MMRSGTFILFVIVLVTIGCGPSPDSMAKKSCAIHEKFIQAELLKDTAEMTRLTLEIGRMDADLTKEYMYKNPEWLMKYVKLRDQCIAETVPRLKPE
jgi:hypothetical protein